MSEHDPGVTAQLRSLHVPAIELLSVASIIRSSTVEGAAGRQGQEFYAQQ